jgi:hypothetical protein
VTLAASFGWTAFFVSWRSCWFLVVMGVRRVIRDRNRQTYDRMLPP